MASFTFASVADRFPVGTSVSAYLPNPNPGAVSPVTGSALATATVASDGSLTFTGLDAGRSFVAYDGTNTRRFSTRSSADEAAQDGAVDATTYSGISTTSADCAAAFNTMLTALAGTDTTVRIPKGTYLVSSPIFAKAGVKLRFDKGAKIKATAGGGFTGSGSANAVIQGVSADAGSGCVIEDAEIDVNSANAHAIQLGGAWVKPIIRRPKLTNCGMGGINIINVGGAAPTLPFVDDPDIDTTGIVDTTGANAAGVRFQTCSNPKARKVLLRNLRGMGVSFVSSPDGEVDSIDYASPIATTVGLEAIGADVNSPRCQVKGEIRIKSSQDNGISLTGADCAVGDGFYIDTCENHGIWIGDRGTIGRGVIKDVGRNSSPFDGASTGAFAAVRFENASNCKVGPIVVSESLSAGERTGWLAKNGGSSPGSNNEVDITFVGPGTLATGSYSGLSTSGSTGHAIARERKVRALRTRSSNSALRETIDRWQHCPDVTAINPTGTVVLSALPLLRGEKITAVTVWAGATVPSGWTHLWGGIWSTAASPVLLANSADDTAGAGWTASSEVVFTLTGTYEVPADDLYYIGFCAVATTVPSIRAAQNGAMSGVLPYSGGRVAGPFTTPASYVAAAIASQGNVVAGTVRGS